MKEVVKTEAGYRAIQLDSSSSLKDFSLDRRKYYKKYVANTPEEDKYNAAVVTGQIVEILLLEPDRFDDKFYISACDSPPTGLMLAFVEALYQEAVASMNADGEITATFEYMSEEAYKASGFKIAYDTVLKKFSETNAVIYFEELCKIKTYKLTVVTANEISNAQKIVEELQSNSITRAIVNQSNSNRYTVLDQHQVENYTVDGHLFKSMIDRIIIDHEKKTIQPYDLKCTWSVETFYTEYYLQRRSYIQAYLYFKACEHLRDLSPDLLDYKVEYLKFIVCDSINYYSPLIYTLSDEDMEDAVVGFDYRGRDYPGVTKIIEDLDWAIENDIWNIGRSAYSENGVINIKHGRRS